MQPRTVCVWFGLLVWFVRWFVCSRNNGKPNHPLPWAQAVAGFLVWSADSQHRKTPSLLDFVLVGLPPDQTQSKER
jgi:hypothetical protein